MIKTKSIKSKNALKQTLLNGVITNTLEYDELGRQKKLTEPNSGITQYKYNAYGELVDQIDANGNESKFQYNDKLGRITSKTISANGVTDTYGYTYVTSGYGLNAVQSLTGPGGITYAYTYDNLNRLHQEDQTIDGSPYSTVYEYDSYGNLQRQTYPGGFAVKHTYNTKGYHTQINRDDNGFTDLIYHADEMTPLGQYSKYTLGNGKQTKKTYNDFGFLTDCLAPGVQNMHYDFDPLTGNLNSRADMLAGLSESFTYDNLDRLKTSSGAYGVSVNYLPNGNINDKSDACTNAGPYTYDPVKINAVKRISWPVNISSTQQNITYTNFNKAQTIIEGDNRLDFTYGPDQERKKTVLTNAVAGTKSTKYFIGDFESTIAIEGVLTTYTNYINSPAGLVAIYSFSRRGAMSYVYTDHLGSILKTTDASGALLINQSFDAWGNYRDPATWQPLPVGQSGSGLRGFTGHEHLPLFGLINMNGRMYDPTVGRMLSPDNELQSPYNTQNHNRYSYCLNNPLKYTDPNGNFVWLIPAIVGGVINVATNWNHIDNVWQGLGYFGSGAVSGSLAVFGPVGWAAGGAITGAANAALGGGSENQIIQGAAVGMFSGLVGGAAGQWAGQNLGGVVINGFNISAKSAIGGAITGAIGGAAGGYAGGFAAGYMMTGDVRAAHQAGLSGLITGAAIGGGVGAAYEYYSAKEAGLNPWTGRQKLVDGWPTPPGKGPFSVGDPSRQKPLMRGEKSIYDKTGGEWRFDANGHQPDYNPHWDYKAPGNNTPWQNIPQSNPPIIELKLFKD